MVQRAHPPIKGIKETKVAADEQDFVLGFDFRGYVRFARCGDVEVPPPEHKTQGAAGLDLYAAIREPFTLGSCQRAAIPTGWAIALPECYYAQVLGRSGLGLNDGITCLTGVIDSDYRGEVKAVLVNLSREVYTVRPMTRIAQLVVMPYVTVRTTVVQKLPDTIRGASGFGSTGQR
jgi:dUTP pyrophosphatase